MPTPGVLLLSAAVFAATLVFLILRAKLPALKLAASPIEHAAQRRADDAEKELERANVAIDSLMKERDDLLKERSQAAVIELVTKAVDGIDQTLAKLGELNGGLVHAAEALKTTNQSLAASTKAVELLVSQILVEFRGHGGA